LIERDHHQSPQKNVWSSALIGGRFFLGAGFAPEAQRILAGWRQPPESPSLLPLRPGRGAGREPAEEEILISAIQVRRPCRGAVCSVSPTGGFTAG